MWQRESHDSITNYLKIDDADAGATASILGLSQKAIRAIKQNLVFSLGVLGIAVGLTVPGILTP